MRRRSHFWLQTRPYPSAYNFTAAELVAHLTDKVRFTRCTELRMLRIAPTTAARTAAEQAILDVEK